MRNKISLMRLLPLLSVFSFGHISYGMESVNKDLKKKEKLKKELEQAQNDLVDNLSESLIKVLEEQGFLKNPDAKLAAGSESPRVIHINSLNNNNVEKINELSSTLKKEYNILTADEVKNKFLNIVADINELINDNIYKEQFGNINIMTSDLGIILSIYPKKPRASELLNKMFKILAGEPFKFSVTNEGNTLRILAQAKSRQLIQTLEDDLKGAANSCIQKLKKQSANVNPDCISQFTIEQSITVNTTKKYNRKPNCNQSTNKKPIPEKNDEELKKRSKKNNNRQKNTKNNNNSKTNKPETAEKNVRDSSKTQNRRNTKSTNLIDSSYTLSHLDVDPRHFKTQFGDDNNHEPVKTMSYSHRNLTYDWITLLEIYGSLFKAITDSKIDTKKELLEIISHGILALDFHNMENNEYLNATINNLASIKESINDNNILLVTNPLFEEFRKAYINYEDEQVAQKNDQLNPLLLSIKNQRIDQLNALLCLIKNHGNDLGDPADKQVSINAVLYILGEHYSRLNKRVFTLKNDCCVLFSNIKKFRISVKHDEDTIDMSGRFIFKIGKNAEGEGSELFSILQKYLINKDSDCFTPKQ